MSKIQIITHEEKLLTAFKNCAIETLEQLIHQNATFVLPNGLVINKATVLENYRSGKTTFAITASDQVITLMDDCAVVSVILDMQGNYEEQVINQKFQYIRVWKLFNEGWKVIATSGVELNR